MVRQGSAKALCVGSIPTLASNLHKIPLLPMVYAHKSAPFSGLPANTITLMPANASCGVGGI